MRSIENYWMKKDIWDIRDAIRLLLGENPDADKVKSSAKYNELYDLAYDAWRAKTMEFLPNRHSQIEFPADVVANSFKKWAAEKGFDFLPEYSELSASPQKATISKPKAHIRSNDEPKKRVHKHIVWLEKKWIELGTVS